VLHQHLSCSLIRILALFGWYLETTVAGPNR